MQKPIRFPRTLLRSTLMLLIVFGLMALVMPVAFAASSATPGSSGGAGKLNDSVYLPCAWTNMDLYSAFSSASSKTVCIEGSGGETFNVTVGAGKITGTGTNSGGCPMVVTGTYGKGKFNLHLEQTQSGACCDYWDVSGTFNKTNKTATGNWVNSQDCGGSGSMTFSKCS